MHLSEVKPVKLYDDEFRKCASKGCDHIAAFYMIWTEPIVVCAPCAAGWINIGQVMGHETPRLTAQLLMPNQHRLIKAREYIYIADELTLMVETLEEKWQAMIAGTTNEFRLRRIDFNWQERSITGNERADVFTSRFEAIDYIMHTDSRVNGDRVPV